MSVLDVDKNTFEPEVLQAEGTVVVVFFDLEAVEVVFLADVLLVDFEVVFEPETDDVTVVFLVSEVCAVSEAALFFSCSETFGTTLSLHPTSVISESASKTAENFFIFSLSAAWFDKKYIYSIPQQQQKRKMLLPRQTSFSNAVIRLKSMRKSNSPTSSPNQMLTSKTGMPL